MGASSALPISFPISKPKKIKRSAVGDGSSMREWKESRTVARPGSEIRPEETWATAYKPWCAENDLVPVTLTKFGTIMKNDLDVEYVERNKRGFYVNIRPDRFVANRSSQHFEIERKQ